MTFTEAFNRCSVEAHAQYFHHKVVQQICAYLKAKEAIGLVEVQRLVEPQLHVSGQLLWIECSVCAERIWHLVIWPEIQRLNSRANYTGKNGSYTVWIGREIP